MVGNPQEGTCVVATRLWEAQRCGSSDYNPWICEHSNGLCSASSGQTQAKREAQEI